MVRGLRLLLLCTLLRQWNVNFNLQTYNRFLLLVAGLGGLLYGVDVAIIAGALPYLEATSGLTAGQLSIVVAAVLLGSVISTVFAGLLSDWLGRRLVMTLSGILFVVSIPTIALSHGYGPLVMGRLLQGISAGLIGVVVPLYLAECLEASSRGKGTAVFQWLLTLGIVAAALVGIYFSYRVNAVASLGNPAKVLAFEDIAWRSIFWVSLPPGALFVLGSTMVAESPRWLFRRGRKEAARAALLRSRTPSQADVEMQEMEQTAPASAANRTKVRDSLLRRKYVVPFLLACIILACNQATGINSIIAYNTNVLIQSGLSDLAAHWGYVIFTIVNFLATLGGAMLVDRKGRKFLLSLGTAGIILALIGTGLLFARPEKMRVDVRNAVQAMVTPDQKVTLLYDKKTADTLLEPEGVAGRTIEDRPTSLIIIYSYGDFRAATKAARSDDIAAKPLEITREAAVPANKVVAFFSNPMGNLDAARRANLKIENALITPVPGGSNGWMVALTLFLFVGFYAVGPGVCVWLALSELMPTRIRSNGMSIALLLNQGVSTTIAAAFLPVVGRYGYSTMFFGFAACTVIYFVTAAFLLPETKGKTLEEIEEHFEHAHG
jgi:SP family myo-inositol transporter-like MFS transporter 13